MSASDAESPDRKKKANVQASKKPPPPPNSAAASSSSSSLSRRGRAARLATRGMQKELFRDADESANISHRDALDKKAVGVAVSRSARLEQLGLALSDSSSCSVQTPQSDLGGARRRPSLEPSENAREGPENDAENKPGDEEEGGGGGGSFTPATPPRVFGMDFFQGTSSEKKKKKKMKRKRREAASPAEGSNAENEQSAEEGADLEEGLKDTPSKGKKSKKSKKRKKEEKKRLKEKNNALQLPEIQGEDFSFVHDDG